MENLKDTVAGADDRSHVALKVAQNLFRFMESFSQTRVEGEVLVVPTTVLDRWMKRFSEKYERDPSFLLHK